MLKANLLPISRCRINQDHNTQKGTAIGAYIRSDSGRITRQTTVSNKHPYTHTRMHTPLPRNWPNETERLRTRIGHRAKRRHRASTLNKYCLMSLHRTARSPPSPPALKSIFASQMLHGRILLQRSIAPVAGAAPADAIVRVRQIACVM